MKNYSRQNATPVYHIETPRKFIRPPLTLHGHTSRKLKHKTGKYHELYGTHAHVRWGGGAISHGWGRLICILHRGKVPTTRDAFHVSQDCLQITQIMHKTQRYSTSLKKFQHR